VHHCEAAGIQRKLKRVRNCERLKKAPDHHSKQQEPGPCSARHRGG
jgi:hypothetical protein